MIAGREQAPAAFSCKNAPLCDMMVREMLGRRPDGIAILSNAAISPVMRVSAHKVKARLSMLGVNYLACALLFRGEGIDKSFLLMYDVREVSGS